MYTIIHKEISVSRKLRRTSKYKMFASSFVASVGCCEICGTTLNLQCHHIKPVRLFPALLLDIENCMCLCGGIDRKHGCHLFKGHLGDYAKYNNDVKYLKRFPKNK